MCQPIARTFQACQELINIPLSSEEDIRRIFALEYSIRIESLSWYNQDLRTRIQTLSIKLLRDAKQILCQRHLFATGRLCALVYKVASSAFRSLAQSNYTLSHNSAKQSINFISCDRKEKIVFKEFISYSSLEGNRPYEEEYVANSLLALLSCRSCLPSYPFKSKRAKQFGVPLDPQSLHYITTEKQLNTYSIPSHLIAKPFVENMILLSDLLKNENARKKTAILNNLVPDAKIAMILAAEVQCLDLHEDNIGIVPLPNSEYEKYKAYSFICQGKMVSFHELHMKFLENQQETLEIEIQIIGQQKKNKIREDRDLVKAFRVQFYPLLFDLDRSIAESNHIQLQICKRERSHIIPHRSAFLQIENCDHDLSIQEINWLLNRSEREARVSHWAGRWDAPLYHHLSTAAAKTLKQMMMPILFQFSLSMQALTTEENSLHSLRENFVKTFSHCVQYNYIWSYIQQNGTAIFLKNITSSTNQGLRKRRKIAYQLFPRLTMHQEKALLERQCNRAEYLLLYQKLAKTKENNLYEIVHKFINTPAIPLDFHSRKILMQNFKDKLPTPLELQQIQKNLLVACKPTVRKVIYSMYPLMADTCELFKYALPRIISISPENPISPEKCIGNFKYPLDPVIELALKSKGKVWEIADHLTSTLRKKEIFHSFSMILDADLYRHIWRLKPTSKKRRYGQNECKSIY